LVNRIKKVRETSSLGHENEVVSADGEKLFLIAMNELSASIPSYWQQDSTKIVVKA